MIPIGVGSTTVVRVPSNETVRVTGFTVALPPFFPEADINYFIVTTDGYFKIPYPGLTHL
jgi:hypothetical protein